MVEAHDHQAHPTWCSSSDWSGGRAGRGGPAARTKCVFTIAIVAQHSSIDRVSKL